MGEIQPTVSWFAGREGRVTLLQVYGEWQLVSAPHAVTRIVADHPDGKSYSCQPLW